MIREEDKDRRIESVIRRPSVMDRMNSQLRQDISIHEKSDEEFERSNEEQK